MKFAGPAIYETSVQVPRGKSHLLFHGVSYAAEVFIDGFAVAEHRGIWDAFAVSLDAYAGKTVSVEVRVTKNGGVKFPVSEVASGFLPYVFNTFGGIYRVAELIRGPILSDPPAPASRVRVEREQIWVDGKPFYLRGLLHWGWYPELGHPNPPEATIREEVLAAKARGFNLVKFCLWTPPHRYLEILRQEGMEAWMELPLWDPSPKPECQCQIAEELERIVRQYRRHDNIIAWTVGCELGCSTPVDSRRHLAQLVRNLTGCPLVKDSSGGAEMYGGDLREFGDFGDFHPYCDLPFFPPVLDSLLPGARTPQPILLGECDDADVHRDISRLGDELPYWASALSELNDRGVRWQFDLPTTVAESRFASQPTRSRHSHLMESSRQKALFTRKTVHEAIRARSAISGYVLNGWRDTPISSSGVFDDWGEARFSPRELLHWNGPTALFLIPHRHPAWVAGGNRPGWRDPQNHFAGPVLWRVGAHTEEALSGGLCWRIRGSDGHVVAAGAEAGVSLEPLVAREVGEINWNGEPGEYRLEVEFGASRNCWPIWIIAQPSWADHCEVLPDEIYVSGKLVHVRSTWSPIHEPALTFLSSEGTTAAPFWREAAYEFHVDSFWSQVPFADQWPRLQPICGDRVLDVAWLREHLDDYEVLMNRVDVRSYVDAPVMVRCAQGIITTLRPAGGLGTQPSTLSTNPAGAALVQALASALVCESP